MNIYVGNLSYQMTNDELSGLFSAYGTVVRANIIMDRELNRSKGFGFVEMDSQEAGEAAIEALDGQDNDGRNLRVNEARPREERPRAPRAWQFIASYPSGKKNFKMQQWFFHCCIFFALKKSIW